MKKIRIASENWGRVWRTLVAAGPISRISEEPIYLVTDEQINLLRRKRLTFELIGVPVSCVISLNTLTIPHE
jgi:hypothetical protein